MRRSTTVVASIVVGIAAIAAGALTFRSGHEAASSGAASAAELFYGQTLADADGALRPMADHRGRVVVVNFWATWCVPCVQEIPALSKANAEAAGKVAFVGLGIDSPGNIAAFNARFRPSYALLAAGASGPELARRFGDSSGALPFTVVLDSDGRVVASHLGRVDATMLRTWLAPYLDDRPS